MSSTFGADPPCYAKPRDTASATNSPPPYHSEASARRWIEKEVAEANAAAEASRGAAAEEAEAKLMKQSHDAYLPNLRDVLKSKARFRIRDLFDESKTELRQELIDQKLMEAGKEEILWQYLGGEERKAMLLAENGKLDSAIDTLETWTELISSQKQKQVSETDDTMRKEATIDLSTIPADVHSAQMLSLSAESAAIDDCIYFLDKALVKRNIPLDVFLKEVRKLSKRQFMAKVRYCMRNTFMLFHPDPFIACIFSMDRLISVSLSFSSRRHHITAKGTLSLSTQPHFESLNATAKHRLCTALDSSLINPTRVLIDPLAIHNHKYSTAYHSNNK
ncbi:MAG: hypothetical protein ACO3QM_06625 [Candidatus Nanopelagicaceae bacterium]